MLEGAVRFKYIFESEIIVTPYKVHVNLNWSYTPMGVRFWEKNGLSRCEDIAKPIRARANICWS